MTTQAVAANDVAGAHAVVELRNLGKTFGGVRALRGVDLTINSGEIHGLLGQNGSGKSTLIKVLAGFHEPDEGGSLKIGGQEVSLPLAPGEFQQLGLRFVHQDLGLIPSLSVLENLNVSKWSSAAEWRISWRQARAQARELFARYGLDLDPRARVGDLRPVQRALLAIVRAISTMPAGDDARNSLLVLDEPTVFLPEDDTALLFDLTRKIADSGAGVLFVSHDLDEVLELTDRITVFRDGAAVGTVNTKGASAGQLVELIVGRQLEVSSHRSAQTQQASDPAVVVSAAAGGLVKEATFSIDPGEVLGVTGLSGAGFEDLPYLLFGVGLATDGSITLGSQTTQLTGLLPLQALRSGIALVPADRQRDGAILTLSVLDNVSMQVLDQASIGPHLRRSQLRAQSRAALRDFDVRPPDPSLTAGSLSGGNQQKVLMAKWLQTKPSLLIVHEPTQGVDVGAREEIYRVLRQAAEDGMAILCASSDHDQLAVLCDRVAVFRQGRIATELTGGQLTKQTISQECYASTNSSERPS
jgi:ribose transport system ATP-binding protein